MSTYALPKNLKLLTEEDYAQVFNQAEQRISCKELLILCKGNTLDHPRLGLVVSKKLCKLSIQRNRIKRIIRETYRHNQHALAHCDYVVLARSGSTPLENSALTQVLNSKWHRFFKHTPQQQ